MKICHFEAGLDKPFFLIAGPCVIESEQLVLDTAATLKEITSELNIPFVFKASFDKANRSSSKNFRGPGVTEGLRILKLVKDTLHVPILTDVHEYTPIEEVAEIADVIQIPAFLCRQTDLVQRAARQGIPINIKKGQFLSPWEMKHIVEKAKTVGNNNISVCERGVSFGYNNLVVDMRALTIMRETGCPIILDATHSVQLPGGGGVGSSGGQPEFIAALSRAAIAVGVSGLFMETHPNPKEALCDGSNMLPLNKMKDLLIHLKTLDSIVKQNNMHLMD